jgi:hypothetical protein
VNPDIDPNDKPVGDNPSTGMTVSSARPSSKGAGRKGAGRRGATKFTPQAVQKIKELVAQGISRDEIANLLDVIVGSLQVTCSRLGISLRRNQNGLARYTLDSGGRTIPARGSIGIVDLHVRKTGEVSQAAANEAPLAKYALTMSHQGKELATNIPLTSRAIEGLALEATFQDLGITQLLGQMLVAAIKKDIIEEILQDEVPPSEA